MQGLFIAYRHQFLHTCPSSEYPFASRETVPFSKARKKMLIDMDGPREYHAKWSKSDRERKILYNITYMWNLKINTDESIYKAETESQM